MNKMKSEIGGWITASNLLNVEAICSTGAIDWLALDLEHSAMSDEFAQTSFMICEKYHVRSFARLSGHDPLQGRRMLDLGAHGLIIPMINSAENFHNLTEHFFYAPQGKRGACLSLMNKWGDTFESYYKNFRPILVPQIETVEGVNNIDSIAAIPSVHALFLGPYDLSASLGSPGSFETPEFQGCIDKVRQASKKFQKKLGIHVVQPNPQELQQKINDGFEFIAYSTDVVALRSVYLNLGR